MSSLSNDERIKLLWAEINQIRLAVCDAERTIEKAEQAIARREREIDLLDAQTRDERTERVIQQPQTIFTYSTPLLEVSGGGLNET